MRPTVGVSSVHAPANVMHRLQCSRQDAARDCATHVAVQFAVQFAVQAGLDMLSQCLAHLGRRRVAPLQLGPVRRLLQPLRLLLQPFQLLFRICPPLGALSELPLPVPALPLGGPMMRGSRLPAGSSGRRLRRHRCCHAVVGQVGRPWQLLLRRRGCHAVVQVGRRLQLLSVAATQPAPSLEAPARRSCGHAPPPSRAQLLPSWRLALQAGPMLSNSLWCCRPHCSRRWDRQLPSSCPSRLLAVPCPLRLRRRGCFAMAGPVGRRRQLLQRRGCHAMVEPVGRRRQQLLRRRRCHAVVQAGRRLQLLSVAAPQPAASLQAPARRSCGHAPPSSRAQLLPSWQLALRAAAFLLAGHR